MKVLLICSECDYREQSSSDRPLIHKIIMWNHVKKAHPKTAERIMRMYKVIPNDLYETTPANF
jgi:hypothetical protein